ncbi:BREX system P-loop protein BrxC [Methanococcoides alaskense]|uniref:ATPase n=1 Tax=Methanococcoides alaskense TaxID=325778 RepID=A0AA90TX41_9EURY|nr:BREX system P-loop protein BrxC [Methanococcoides alaskense]MDA0525425.1 BREX system P-loop protein BrxC [Methanococcoides alaskense]MDR6221642.1 hypothetical protein [Methanococcoides alaskense]
MTSGTKIEDLFLKDVKRNINGVIKVDQDDDASIYTELDEYVVTKESREHFDKFFSRYLNATQESTDKIGVWVSGFFGSGKSHFIKILSYLMENRTVHGKTSLDFFRDKIEDALIFDSIERSVNYGTKDVILFNIDSKASTVDRDNELIVNVMMRAFNEKRGYYRDVFWIAEMEEDMDNKGLYGSFKEEFLKINGDTWENKRSSYSFEQDDIVEALVNCGYQSREANERLFDNDGQAYHFDVEKFAEKLKKYCDSKGNDHQVIFLIDEIGQYIGANSELMLNLQTIVEELGTKLVGKAWVIVTSQADIDLITQEKVKGYDFSKIQGRFDTRLSLSSANVDEVIKRRILDKKDDYKDMLSVYYGDNQTILKNLLLFSNGTAQMKLYSSSDDFVNVYPFVPYQFIILQKVFDQIRQTGYTGKHLAKGERSMLNAFKEASEKYCDNEIGVLVPFSSFYSTVESFLDPIITRTIKQAEANDVLNNADCDILKMLFMIRHVVDVQANLENLVALSVSSVNEDKLELKKSVAESLIKLEGQTLINKSGDSYSFLTNEEQEINREIKNLDVDRHLILDDIFNVVFNSNDICPVKHSKYVFDRALDDKTKSANNADITVKFLTPMSDEVTRGSGQRSLSGDNLSNIDSKDTLLFIFPEKSDFVDIVKKYLRINKYLTQNSSRSDNDIRHRILLDKKQDLERLKESAVRGILDGASEARIFVHGKEVSSIGNKNPKERVKEGLDVLFENVYSKYGYVTRKFDSDSDVLKILRSNDLEKYGIGKSDTNKRALKEVLDYVDIRTEKNDNVVLKEVKSRFSGKPYGWNDLTISGLVATLFTNEDIRLRYQKTTLQGNPEEIARYLTRKDDAERVILEIRKPAGMEIINDVKSILRDVFDRTAIPDKEKDLFDLCYEIISEEMGSVERIAGKYAEEKRYPGEKDILAYEKFLKRLLSITDPSQFLGKLSEDKVILHDLKEKVSPVMRFFGSPQVDIFRKVAKKIGSFKRNEQFLDADGKFAVKDIGRILALEQPYPEIKTLTGYEISIDSSLKASLEILKKQFFDRLESVKIEIEDEFGHHATLSNDFKLSVLKPFEKLEVDVTSSDECSFVKLQLDRLEGELRIVFDEISKQLQVIKEATAPVEVDGESGIPDPMPVVRGTKMIEHAVFRTPNTIRSEEELDKYLESLRSKLIAILEESNIKF